MVTYKHQVRRIRENDAKTGNTAVYKYWKNFGDRDLVGKLKRNMGSNSRVSTSRGKLGGVRK